MSSFEDLPAEIYLKVFKHLSQQEIRNCKDASPKLRSAALRTVWRHLRLKFDEDIWWPKNIGPAITIKESNCDDFIQKKDNGELDYALSAVSSLTVEFNEGSHAFISSFLGTLSEEIANHGVPGLVSCHVKVIGSPTSRDGQETTFKKMKRKYRPLKLFVERAYSACLGQVTLTAHRIRASTVRWVGQNVEHLEIGGNLVVDSPLPRSVRSLTVVDGNGLSSKDFETLISECTNLKVLAVKNGQISPKLFQFAPLLESVSYRDSLQETSQNIVQPRVLAPSRLTNLELDRPATMIPLGTSFPSLESVTLLDNWYMEVQDLLSGCRFLRTLTIATDELVNLGRLATAAPGIQTLDTLILKSYKAEEFAVKEFLGMVDSRELDTEFREFHEEREPPITWEYPGPLVNFTFLKRFICVNGCQQALVLFITSLWHLLTGQSYKLREAYFSNDQAFYTEPEKVWVGDIDEFMYKVDLNLLKQQDRVRLPPAVYRHFLTFANEGSDDDND